MKKLVQKIWCQAVRNTLSWSGEIQLAIFEKYCKSGFWIVSSKWIKATCWRFCRRRCYLLHRQLSICFAVCFTGNRITRWSSWWWWQWCFNGTSTSWKKLFNFWFSPNFFPSSLYPNLGNSVLFFCTFDRMKTKSFFLLMFGLENVRTFPESTFSFSSISSPSTLKTRNWVFPGPQ